MNMKDTTRRSFLKVAGVTAAYLITGIQFSRKVYAEAINVIQARLSSVYRYDGKMKYRKSQDNPEIKAIYKNYLKHPLSKEGHHLLHTHYVDRSKTLS